MNYERLSYNFNQRQCQRLSEYNDSSHYSSNSQAKNISENCEFGAIKDTLIRNTIVCGTRSEKNQRKTSQGEHSLTL